MQRTSDFFFFSTYYQVPRSSSKWMSFENKNRLNKKSRIYGTSDRSDLSVYLSALLKSASNVQILFSDWLRGITWENKLNLPQMYGILYIWGRFLKCTALWLAQRQNRPQMFAHFTENLIFDSNSTSDRIYQMC